jgi:hypothetical protein
MSVSIVVIFIRQKYLHERIDSVNNRHNMRAPMVTQIHKPTLSQQLFSCDTHAANERIRGDGFVLSRELPAQFNMDANKLS